MLVFAPALDGLRAMAVLLVLATHALVVFVPEVFATTLSGGFLGVDLFFVLSGFLITTLLLNEDAQNGRISFGSFYLRRVRRLLPAVFLLLIVHFAYAVLTGLPLDTELFTIAVIVGYVSNWALVIGRELAPGLGHFWSLSIEEQFYLVWPVVTAFFISARSPNRFVIAIFCALIFAVMVWRAMLWRDGLNFFEINYIYMRTDTRADTLLIGALAGHLWTRRLLAPELLRPLAWIALALFLACVMWLPPWNGFYYKGLLTLLALAAAIVVLAVVEGKGILAWIFSLAPLRAIGRVSYGIYLWHLPTFFAVKRYCTSWPSGYQIGLALLLTLVFTLASWTLVETRFHRRRGRPNTSAKAEPN